VNPTRLMIVFCGCLAAGALWPPDAAAQRRGGHPTARGRTSVVVSAGYYRPYYRPYYRSYYPSFAFGFGGFYSPYYGPYYSGWDPFYAQYPYPYPYPYPARYYSGGWASARLEVKPRDAQVYLDGYFVGVVDQFDGVFQRLDLPTGEHEIVAYQKGHRTYRQRTLFRPGESYTFKAILEPLPAGTPDEPVPQASAPDPNRDPRDPRDPYARAPYGRDSGDDPNRQPPPPQPGDRGRTMPDRPGDRRGPESNSFGTLNLRVQPGDATVVIDGERWDSPEGGTRLSVQLAAGPHRIEVRKDGFKPYMSTIQIRPGEAQALNISLPPGQ
jgi:PEGA domain